MTISVVPYEDPEQTQILYEYIATAYDRGWWDTQTITQIPSEVVGWLVAQGWQITDITYDTTTVPQTPSFAMRRDSLQNPRILEGLLNSWVYAHNLANANNTIRYNDIVEDWQEMIVSSQTHFTNQVTEQTGHTTAYLADIGTYMTTVEAIVQAADYETDVDAVLALLLSDYSTHETDIDGDIALLLTDYATHKTNFSAVLDELSGDYDLHEVTAKGFLTDLGATELARINEAFDASLAAELQKLTDQGLYSSLASAAVTRNGRDRSEEIAALNDRLNREKLENQHRLFEQQAGMRGRKMDGEGRIYDRQSAMRDRRINAKDRLYEQQQAVRARTLEGQGLIRADAHREVAELMTTYALRLDGSAKKHAEDMDLTRYQLTERNQLLVGLYGFVERRDDVAPAFESLTQIATALGDAGGGWITP
jgi:hypothetical protein